MGHRSLGDENLPQYRQLVDAWKEQRALLDAAIRALPPASPLARLIKIGIKAAQHHAANPFAQSESDVATGEAAGEAEGAQRDPSGGC